MNKAQFTQKFILHDLNANAAETINKQRRQAAVLVPIVERNHQLSCLLTTRASHLRHHGGQISFPGGKVDDDDASLIDTALRETREEIGISADFIDIYGQLNPISTISGFNVYPVVAGVDANYQLNINQDEVDDVFEVPLSFLLDEANHHTQYYHRGAQAFPVYFIPYKQRNIWGATASILRDLMMHIRNVP